MSAKKTLKERIGIDVGRKLSVEAAVEWAARNGVRAIDCQIDIAPNALRTFDSRRIGSIREAADRAGIEIALHTLSAVNIAEVSPFVSEAVDAYLEAYVDVARDLRASWIVVHGGYHFTADYRLRREASIERLRRISDYAERNGVRLLLENLNKEPPDAEVHYMPYNLEECLDWFGALTSPALGWSFTVNHAHMCPEGIMGTLEGMGISRLGEVRIADNKGDKEEHLFPGEGTIDFTAMFQALEGRGYRGAYTCAFGSLEDMLRGREVLARAAANAGSG
jgi:sugar phosphate isomerase/epimerase